MEERKSLSQAELQEAAADLGWQPEQASALWARLPGNLPSPAPVPAPASTGGPDLVQLAFYLGALMVLGAMSIFMGAQWDALGDGGVLACASLYALGLLALSQFLHQRGWSTPAGLMLACAVGCVPLIAYASQQLLGLWPGQENPGPYQDYYDYIHPGWTVMEVATLVAGALALRWRAYPFILLPTLLALWFLAMDLSELLFGNQANDQERGAVSLAVGLLMLGSALALDWRRERAYAFWFHLGGLLSLLGGLFTLLQLEGAAGSALLILALGLLGLALSVLLQRMLYLLSGGLGVFVGLNILAFQVFENALLFPFVLAGSGIGVVLAGIWLGKNREGLRERMLGGRGWANRLSR